jgi:predicted DCC family thiol-disulfide oxidoreductase YuxK
MVLYDSECVMCTGAANAILQLNPKGDIGINSLNHPRVAGILKTRYGIDDLDVLPDSIVVLNRKEVLVNAPAIIEIAGYLRSPFRFLKYAKYIPVGLLNAVYRLIARNRYRFLGKRNSCQFWPPEERYRMDFSNLVFIENKPD